MVFFRKQQHGPSSTLVILNPFYQEHFEPHKDITKTLFTSQRRFIILFVLSDKYLCDINAIKCVINIIRYGMW